MRRSFVLASLLAVGLASGALYACGDDDNTVPGPKDAGPVDGSTGETGSGDTGAKDSGQDAPVDTGVDSGKVPVRCTDADFDQDAGAGGGDFTGFPGVDISFPNDGTIQQYVNHCAKVKPR